MSLKKIVYASAIALALTASNAHAFASDCGDSLWKFSAIEALTCVFSVSGKPHLPGLTLPGRNRVPAAAGTFLLWAPCCQRRLQDTPRYTPKPSPGVERAASSPLSS